MRRALYFLPVPLVAGLFVPVWADANTDAVDAMKQNQQVIELRVSGVEERLGRIESMLEQLVYGTSGKAPQGKTTPAPSVAQAPPLTVQVAPPSFEPAPPPPTVASPPPAASDPTPPAELMPPMIEPLPPQADRKLGPRDAAPPQYLGVVITDPPPRPTPHLTLAKATGAEYAQSPIRVVQEAPEGGSPARVDSPSGPGLEPTAAAPAAPRRQQPRQQAPAQRSGGKGPYDAALALYYKGDYGKAQEAFKSFLQSSPRSSLAPNAMYWEGECLYSLGKYDQAILVFKDVVTKYPKHDKAAASLLKAGYSYERMSDMENAKFYWQILLDDFPGSAPANLARKRLGTG